MLQYRIYMFTEAQLVRSIDGFLAETVIRMNGVPQGRLNISYIA